MTPQNTKKPTKTVFYPASYLVMTVTSFLLLIAVTGLGAMLIHYWISGVSDILNDTFILYWIASLLILTPMHLLAYWNVRHTDKSKVTIFSVRVAHGLLGVYLLATVGSFILLSTWLLATLLNALFGTGDIDENLLASSLSLLVAIAVFFYSARHFRLSRVEQSRPKYYVITIITLSVLVLILSTVFPIMAYRDVARDFKRENSLGQINQAIGDYVDTNSNLPKTLGDLSSLNATTANHLADYEYAAKGETNFGIFGYTLCTDFTRSKDKGYDTGFGFASHGAGRQCFTRTTISFTKLNEDIAQYAKNVDNGAAKLKIAIQNFLAGAKNAVDQEVTSVESFAGSQVKQLEGNLEGLDGGMADLEKEMLRLEGNLGGLQGNTGELAQDFAAVEKFLHDLGCAFGGCK